MRLKLSDVRTVNLGFMKRDAEYITQDARYWSFFFKMTTTAVTEKGKTMIKEINPSLAELVKQNDGYCPCAIVRNKDTKCMCKEFREAESGVCHCGRFEKVRVEK